jgi:hypothetical protein
MERASKLISKLALPGETISGEEIACRAWAPAVGKRIACHTRAAKLVRLRLVVEVEDDVWRKQLFALRPHIVRNLNKLVGAGLVEDLEFRVIPRRLEPRRAVSATAADEADLIGDPVMRGIYKASRKRALA